MVSSTKQTERRRRMKAATGGRGKKSERAKNGTPKFPVHLDAGHVETAPAAAKK